METETKQNNGRAVLIILAVVLAVAAAASCVLSALTMRTVAAQAAQVTELSQLLRRQAEDNGSVTQEDDVQVAGEYWIRSTLPISDAYRTGDDSALDDRQRETLKLASTVLEEIITDGMSDYEKEKAVYDWMCAHLSIEGGVTVAIPTAAQSAAEPWGVLTYKRAVCVGFATTFRLFMQMMDIDCMVVHNSAHSWDLVKLDGEWYHTDLYFAQNQPGYVCFNMTDDMCALDHEWDREFYPAADSLTYCYAYQAAQPLEDLYALPAMVRALLEKGAAGSLYLRLPAAEQDQWMLPLNRLLSELDYAANSYISQSGLDGYLSYDLQQAGDSWLLTFQFTLYNYEEPEPDRELTDEELEKISQAIRDAFGDVDDDGWDLPIDDDWTDWTFPEVAE